MIPDEGGPFRVYYAWGADVTKGEQRDFPTASSATAYAKRQVERGWTVAVSVAAATAKPGPMRGAA